VAHGLQLHTPGGYGVFEGRIAPAARRTSRYVGNFSTAPAQRPLFPCTLLIPSARTSADSPRQSSVGNDGSRVARAADVDNRASAPTQTPHRMHPCDMRLSMSAVRARVEERSGWP
jgi:hypothetical protein